MRIRRSRQLRAALFWHGYAVLLEDQQRWAEAEAMYRAGIAATADESNKIQREKLQEALKNFL